MDHAEQGGLWPADKAWKILEFRKISWLEALYSSLLSAMKRVSLPSSTTIKDKNKSLQQGRENKTLAGAS